MSDTATFGQWLDSSAENKSIWNQIKETISEEKINRLLKIKLIETSFSTSNPLLSNHGQGYLFDTSFADYLIPYVPVQAGGESILFIDHSFTTLPEQVKLMFLSYALFFIDWHEEEKSMAMKNNYSALDEQAMDFMDMFYSEYKSFTLFLASMKRINRPLNMQEIRSGAFSAQGLGPGESLTFFISYWAKVIALAEYDAAMGQPLKDDRGVADFFARQIGNMWGDVKSFFSKPRTLQEADECKEELCKIIAPRSHDACSDFESLHKLAKEAFSQNHFDEAVKYEKEYLAEAKKNNLNKKISFALSNLHTYLCNAGKFDEAGRLMPELIYYANETRDFVSTAYAYLNMMSDTAAIHNVTFSISLLNQAIDSVLSYTDKEMQQEKANLVQIANTIKENIVLYIGVHGIETVADKFSIVEKRISRIVE